MFGDICPSCNCVKTSCTCDDNCNKCDNEPEPCLPCDTGECSMWLPASCVFWMGDPIAGTPIVKGTKLSAAILYLLERIKTIEDQL